MPRILSGAHKIEAEKWYTQAIIEAKKATCTHNHRSKCGCIIVKDDKIIGRGYNSPPANLESQRRCGTKPFLKAGFDSDKTCCVHAEQRAIMDALRHHGDQLTGARLYFIRVNQDNEMLHSGTPCCTICSKMSLDVGISEFLLWSNDGITAYDTQEYNDVSFDHG